VAEGKLLAEGKRCEGKESAFYLLHSFMGKGKKKKKKDINETSRACFRARKIGEEKKKGRGESSVV